MTPLLAPFESDLSAALEISDSPTRVAVLDLLAKLIHRDRLGRFASTGSGGAGAAEGGAGGEGGGGGAAGEGGTVTAEQAREALLTNLDVTMAPDQVDGLMRSMAGGQPVNLEHLQVTGTGNENMFARHATETPRSAMPQLPETMEGMKAFTDDLAARGVGMELRRGVDPRTLHATQNELDGAKVGAIYGAIRSGGWQSQSVIIASREGAVVDGHHRWAAGSAAVIAGERFGVNVLQVDMPITELLDIAQAHSGERRAMGAPLTVPKSLEPWEADLWTVLELSDAFARGRLLELLAKEQARDRLGRFAGGGSGTSTSSELADMHARAEAGGFTYSPATHKFAATGFAVSPYPERTRVIPTKEFTPAHIAQYRQDNADLLAKPGHHLGAWREKDGDTDQVWLDVSIVSRDRAEAARIGRRFDQVAMFDLGKGETIDLGGTGGQKAHATVLPVLPWQRRATPIRGPDLGGWHG